MIVAVASDKEMRNVGSAQQDCQVSLQECQDTFHFIEISGDNIAFPFHVYGRNNYNYNYSLITAGTIPQLCINIIRPTGRVHVNYITIYLA